MDRNKICRVLMFHGLLAGTILSCPALLAEPITPWNGGSSSVEAVGQTSSQQGSLASASAQGSTDLYYSSIYNSDPNAFHVKAQGSANANVSGTASNLLQVDATYSVGNPGTRPYGFHSDVNASSTAEASWTGDRIHIGPDSSGSIPDSIRLGVTVDLTNAWGQFPYIVMPKGGTLDIQVGNQHIQLSDSNAMVANGLNNLGDISDWLLNRGFASVQKEISPSGMPLYHAKAFLDLPVDANGWTAPFDLSLKATLSGVPQSNMNLWMEAGAFSLSLDDITQSDGTNVVDAGHVVTFESGLAWATPVPEPGSFALAASMALGAIGLRRRLLY
ncbi:PEP-CTERM sorting domain-containing protein [Singulisphaera sp. PoT]|uniref:PEP-CTERM sorting domain-containing protein n=1 Tax=Singulisphaera sp. PoT TaxID=3411797 RepID=UPI003BF47454